MVESVAGAALSSSCRESGAAALVADASSCGRACPPAAAAAGVALLAGIQLASAAPLKLVPGEARPFAAAACAAPWPRASAAARAAEATPTASLPSCSCPLPLGATAATPDAPKAPWSAAAPRCRTAPPAPASADRCGDRDVPSRPQRPSAAAASPSVQPACSSMSTSISKHCPEHVVKRCRQQQHEACMALLLRRAMQSNQLTCAMTPTA